MHKRALSRIGWSGMMLLSFAAYGQEPDAAELRSSIEQVTTELREYSARRRGTQDEHAHRKATRDKWHTYTTAKTGNVNVKRVQLAMRKALGRMHALQAQQESTAAADSELSALKAAYVAAVNASESAGDAEREAAAAGAREARTQYRAAWESSPQIAELQAQIDELSEEVVRLREQERLAVDADAGLVDLKTEWQRAKAEADDYLPTRKKLAELAKRREALQQQLATLEPAR